MLFYTYCIYYTYSIYRLDYYFQIRQKLYVCVCGSIVNENKQINYLWNFLLLFNAAAPHGYPTA
jgi:hypothetical protein